MEWLRWYLGTTEDGKFRMVARHASVTVCHAVGVWAALLEDAASLDHRGIATRGEDFYAAVLDLEPSQVEAILSAMEYAGLIHVEPGCITIKNWKQRQFETDVKDPTAAARQQRARDKRKHNDEDTLRHGVVTVESRPDTDTDTDTDTDKKDPPIAPRKRVASLSAEQSKLFDEWWQVWPVKQGKEPAKLAFLAALSRGATVPDLTAGARRYAEVLAAPDPPRPKFPQGWLNDSRWLDEMMPNGHANGRTDGSGGIPPIQPIQPSGPRSPPPRYILPPQ